MQINILKICFLLTLPALVFCIRKYSPARKAKLREEVRGMFQHAYDGYLQHASDYDELRPLTCDGINTWGSYSLTLIDALDTLAVMGNYTEYRRVAESVIKNMNFDNDINVSVFETNIRIVGGLLSAHLMAHKAGMDLEPGWPCNGPLLRLAEDVAKRLLPAFNSKTGMPYGTVNLRHGVPPSETSVTCTAGVGTFIVEFGTLSRLTGDPIYEEVALNAIYSLWNHRSNIGLLGNHIDVQTGRWTAQDAGIGAGVDSFFEYLVKGAILLNRPDLLEMFHEGRNKIDRYMKRDDWYVWVGMNKGQVTLPVFQSLEAYWPGVLSLVGDISHAMKILHNYHTVWRQYGFLPEFYNIPGAEAGANRESYPLRPELAESAMYLYRATKDPYLLEIGEDMLRSIEYSAKTSCGYATIRNVRDHRRDNRMESFFLSETTKYLYLLFDEDNFLHNNGGEGHRFETPNGMCVLEAGGYIFNTEAHPIDPSALHCCYDLPQSDIFQDFNLVDYHGDILMQKERQCREEHNSEKYVCPHQKISLDTKGIDTNISIDIEVLDANESVIDLAKEMLENFKKIQEENIDQKQINPFFIKDLLDSINNVSIVDEMPTMLLNFMKNHIGDPKILDDLSELKSHTDMPKVWSIWSLYVEKQRLRANAAVIEAMGLHKFDKDDNETYAMLSYVLEIFNSTEQDLHKLNGSSILRNLTYAQIEYTAQMVNASAMFDFTLLFAKDNKTNTNASYVSELEKTKEKLTAISTPNVHFPNTIDLELFERMHRIVKFKKRMIDTFDKLQNLMENKEKQAVKSPKSYQEPNLSDVRQDSQSPSISETNEGENDKSAIVPPNGIIKEKTLPTSDEPTNKSILTEFVHSIIKSTLPPKPRFDEQFLLSKIRSQGLYMNQTQNYQLLTCGAHTFAERFAYRYEVV